MTDVHDCANGTKLRAAARKQCNKAGADSDQWTNIPRERRARTGTRKINIGTSTNARSLPSNRMTATGRQRGTTGAAETTGAVASAVTPTVTTYRQNVRYFAPHIILNHDVVGTHEDRGEHAHQR